MAQQDAPERKRVKIRHLLLALLVLLLGWAIFFRVSAHVKLKGRLSELRAQGYPLSLRELGETYRLAEGTDNAATANAPR